MAVSGRIILILICTYFSLAVQAHGKITDIKYLIRYITKLKLESWEIVSTKDEKDNNAWSKIESI